MLRPQNVQYNPPDNTIMYISNKISGDDAPYPLVPPDIPWYLLVLVYSVRDRNKRLVNKLFTSLYKVEYVKIIIFLFISKLMYLYWQYLRNFTFTCAHNENNTLPNYWFCQEGRMSIKLHVVFKNYFWHITCEPRWVLHQNPCKLIK